MNYILNLLRRLLHHTTPKQGLQRNLKLAQKYKHHSSNFFNANYIDENKTL